jgi:adenylosuccinate lyase
MIDRYATPEMLSLWGEVNRYQTWLEVELAATEAWERLGEVPDGTALKLRTAVEQDPLDEAFAERVAAIESETRHDIVAFTRALTERFGPDARFVHLGLTSTDIVDTSQNLLLRAAMSIVITDLVDLSSAVRDLAVQYKTTPCVGRTHGIHAEPMTFGLKFLFFHSTLARDLDRLKRARESISVAMLSGSVGTYAHVPPEVERLVAEDLGLMPEPISNQTVSRDRHAELLAALAIVGTTVERIAVEIRHLQRTEVREVMEGFSTGQTGSSSMPHKRNPIATENLTGVARILRANLQAGLENVALWHERDISHSSVERFILPDSTALASYALRRLTRVVSRLEVFPERMAENLDQLGGLIFSQRVLHKLISKGMMREEAYDVVQRNSLLSWDSGTAFRELLEADSGCPLVSSELDEAFDVEWYLRYVDEIFGRFSL